MNRLRQILFRLQPFFRRKNIEAGLSEEMRAHLEMATEVNIAAGMSPEEAGYAARREFGGVDQVKEAWRDERTVVWLEQTLMDFRHACRSLAHTPGFTAIAVVTLALGLTVNGIVFLFASDFFLRPLPALESDQLVVIAQRTPLFEYAFPFSYPDLDAFRRCIQSGPGGEPDMAEAFSSLMGYKEESVQLSRTGELSERTWLHAVSDNYFSVLGVPPACGRLFLPGEGLQPGADPIIVLTDSAWRTRFAADPRIVGQQVKVNGVALTVVGVMPPGFFGAAWGTALSGFVPATMLPLLSPAHGQQFLSGGNTAYFLMGRLQPGASLGQAQAAIEVAMARLIKERPQNFAPQVKPIVMRERLSRPSPFVASYTPLIVAALMTLALLVLAVAAANVTGLLYARAATRERELAVRGALGASRGRLMRQLLVESVVLALIAGAVGTVAVYFLNPYLNAVLPTPPNMAPPAVTGVDWRLFAFTFGISLATGILTGLLPAAKATRLAVLPVLKEGTPSAARTRTRLRSTLVVAQVAVSCVVLVCAGLALRSLQQLSRINLGFQPGNLTLASFDLELQRYTPNQGRQFHARLLEKVRNLPGVQAASLADHVPFDVGGSMSGGITAEGRPATNDGRFQFIPCLVVDYSYFETAGLRIKDGRGFNSHDDFGTPRVAIINRVLAEHFWPGESPIGKRLSIQGNPVEVVGLAADVRYWAITDRARPLIFLPLAQNYRGGGTLVVRTEGETGPLVAAIEGIVRQLDPDLPVYNVRTMDQQIARSSLALMPLRMGATIAGAQGAIALLLAGLGIFGLIAFTVTRRTREIGIRMALGAGSGEVVRLVTCDGLRLVAFGIGSGLLLSLGLTRVLASLLYGVSPTDATVFLAVPALVLAITLLACWLPARKATRVNPVEALRAE